MSNSEDSPYDCLVKRVERLEHENETLRYAISTLQMMVETYRNGDGHMPNNYELPGVRL